MARSKRKPFSAAGPFVVRRRIRYSGQYLIPGTAFDHLECGARRTRQLWDNRMIDVGLPTVKEKEPRIHSDDRKVEDRLSKMIEWRSMNRVELIEYVKEEFGVTCSSKKQATEFMEEREANS